MNLPFQRSKPLPVRMLNAVAATAGSARGLVRNRTRPVEPKHKSRFARLTHRD